MFLATTAASWLALCRKPKIVKFLVMHLAQKCLQVVAQSLPLSKDRIGTVVLFRRGL